MSDSDSPDQPGNNPLFDLSRLFAGAGDPWASAEQLAAAVASEGGSEPNVDPIIRLQFEELARVAELQVSAAPGVSLPPATTVVPVTRSLWTTRSFDTYRPFFERFGEAVSAATDPSAFGPGADAGAADPFGAMFGQLFGALGPMLVSASAGSMLGHLGQRALGQYDLPVPRTNDEVLVVPSNIDAAATEWGVDRDGLRLWIMIHEFAAHAVLRVPHVQKRMESLLIDFAAAFTLNPDALGEQFSSLGNITDLSQIQELSEQLNDPELLLTMLRSPAHDLLVPQFDAMVASVIGFVGHTVDRIASGLIADHAEIRQQFRQRWIDVAPADRFMERLLGLEITAATFERGDAFVNGIDERAGAEGLERLWADELDLPTAAEVDAPGLWLARIGFDTEPGQVSTEVPDDLSGLDDL
ncbi:MAG: zinc-dependent metalloprotease [Actinomycetota bacterium]